MEKIYHITHINNLAEILRRDCLVSDHGRMALNLQNEEIGYSHIKERRRNRRVPVAAGGVLADYVPFYFCPRSPMLYAIWQGSTDYQGGQTNVIHLEVNVSEAAQLGKPWAFTNMHADLGLAEFFTNLSDLCHLRWDIIGSGEWGGDERRPYKQAEFLIFQDVPWTAIEKIGVSSTTVAGQVEQALQSAVHKPAVEVQPSWYY